MSFEEKTQYPMPSLSGPHLSLGTRSALRGLNDSVQHVESNDAEQVLTSVGTALFWACALDEQLAADQEYRSRRNGDRSGELLAGLRLGRNAIAHGVAPIALPSRGFSAPLTSPIVFTPATWTQFDGVRRGLDREPGAFARGVWERRLAGSSVLSTLKTVRTWLSESVAVAPRAVST